MSTKVEQVLRQCDRLPSLSAIALRVVELARAPEADSGRVVETLSNDPALAAKIIRVANSPLYGQSRVIKSLSQAVMLLGLNAVVTLGLSFSLSAGLSTSGLSARCLERYWRRSLLAALAARLLGDAVGQREAEELFLAGLLQDIGMLALESALGERYAQVANSAASHDELLRLEREAFRFDHVEAGTWLLRHWKLPDYLAAAAAASHGGAAVERRGFTGCVVLSGRLADVFLQEPDARTALAAARAGGQALGLSTTSLRRVLERLGQALPEVEALFEMALASPEQVVAVTEQARELLAERSLQLIQGGGGERTQALQAEKERLEDAVLRDPLTRLYNREYLQRELGPLFARAVREQAGLSLAFLDLDHFKAVNDQHGHLVGDEVLTATAAAIRAELRAEDVAVRYGGEEFVVLLPGLEPRAAAAVLERLRVAVAAQVHPLPTGGRLQVTISVGLAGVGIGNEEVADAEDLLRAADEALYAAKRAGRDRVVAAFAADARRQVVP